MARPAFALDTNCMVAAVCSWHEHHPAAAAGIERRLQRGERLVTPAPALVEAYAVLTRLPAPHRLAPVDAWTLLQANFVEDASVAVIPPATYASLLAGLASAGTAGGRAYDAVIAACASHARAETLLTFNRRHFEPAPSGPAIVEPGGR